MDQLARIRNPRGRIHPEDRVHHRCQLISPASQPLSLHTCHYHIDRAGFLISPSLFLETRLAILPATIQMTSLTPAGIQPLKSLSYSTSEDLARARAGSSLREQTIRIPQPWVALFLLLSHLHPRD